MRNSTITELVQGLQAQRARRLDLVVPGRKISTGRSVLDLMGLDSIIEEDGVTDPNGLYLPTPVFHEGVADKLGIPVAYLKRLAAERADIYDDNVNGFLTREDRPFLLRLFQSQDGPGVARAFLSDRYCPMDNLDIVMSVLEGIDAAGINARVTGADLTDRRMVVRIEAPEVAALAPDLLKGYRSPFTGAMGDANPVVFAGFQISNSETGNGALSITPRVVAEVCHNGMVITKDAMRAVHLGGRLEAGVVRWSAETEKKNLDLMRLKARDAVTSFLNKDYVVHAIEELTAKAGHAVAKVDEVKVISKKAGYTAEQIDGILANFISGGQMSRGGIMQAATAYAQQVEDGDEAYEIEGRAVALLTA